MPPYVSPPFNYHGRRSNQFYDHELAEFLTGKVTPEGQPVSLGIAFDVQGADSQRYTAELKKSDDGKKIILDATLRRDGFTYKTEMTAVLVKENLYEITALTFDNHKERIDSRWELSKVLGHIGSEQVKKGMDGKIPAAHQEKGKFGKFARFFDRMIPDDPSTMVMPPF